MKNYDLNFKQVINNSPILYLLMQYQSINQIISEISKFKWQKSN
ncbi:unnamed protein product, partial [marine sediment metagenome]